MPHSGSLLSVAVGRRPAALPAATRVRQYAPWGPWQPVRLLGRGRRTLVFQARPIHAPDDAPADYVIKALDPDFAEDPIAHAAMAREAQVARELCHPNLPVLLAAQLQRAPIHLAFLHEQAVSARRLIAASASESATTRPPLNIPTALWVVRQAAEGLSALHTAGWLHGDIKPDNLLVTPQGRTTVIDLGFARKLNTAECETTAPLAGSYVYAAPETIVPQDGLSPATDVYSLGITLFELLTGHPPMDTSDRATVVGWHLRSAAPELRERLPHAPLRLARLVRAMLARQPLRRPGLTELIPWIAELEIDTLGMR